MKISYNWLKQFFKLDIPAEEVGVLLTDLGLEVEGIEKYESVKGGLKGVVVGHVLTCVQHPNADRLKITTVNIGTETLQIVCGAPNVAEGQKVCVATIGTILYDDKGESFEIKKGKIRGEDSFGMLCGPNELGLGEDTGGLLILDENLEAGAPLAEVYQVETDEVFEIGLTPNRSDAMSHFGVARDLRAGLLQKNKQVELITPSVSSYRAYKKTLKVKVKIENNELVPQYYCVAINDVKVTESPNWLKNRLQAIGIKPKNNVVDITNYVMHEIGQPLHAFDANAFEDYKLEVRTLPTGTKFTSLDGVERELHEEDLVICNNKKPLCLAGVMGGLSSGVTKETKTVILESAYFNPITVRKTAKRHSISSDSSYRFERGVDPDLTEYALKRAALLIQEIAKGEISSEIEEFSPKKFEPKSIFLNFAKVTSVVGEEIPKDIIKRILVSLDIKVMSINDTGLGILIPPYRVDVTRDIDVIEEILRVYGYNNVKFSKKVSATMFRAPRTEDTRVQNIIADQLTALGFNEMMANSLTSPEHVKLADYLKEEHNVVLLNPLSNDLSALRQSLLFGGLEAISFNINRKRADIKFFEFGKSYHKIEGEYQENKHLTLLITGTRTPESWATTAQKSSFFQFKSYVLTILERLGIASNNLVPTDKNIFQEGLDVVVNNQVVVSFGTIQKNVLKHFDIKQEVLFADFDWSLVLELLNNKIKSVTIPKYPEVRRDLSLLLDENIEFKTVKELAQKTEKHLLKTINLFDVYQGDKLPEGKKSYAISFILQDVNQTLTDEQIDKIMTNLKNKFEKELQAELR